MGCGLNAPALGIFNVTNTLCILVYMELLKKNVVVIQLFFTAYKGGQYQKEKTDTIDNFKFKIKALR